MSWLDQLVQRFSGQRVMFWVALLPIFSSAIFVVPIVAYFTQDMPGVWAWLLYVVACGYLAFLVILPCMFLFEVLNGTIARGHFYEDQLVQRGCDRQELRKDFEALVRARGHW